MYRSVLVPLDGSTFGEHALLVAQGIAYRAGAALQLAHVHVPVSTKYIEGMIVLDETLEAQNKERERAYLEGTVKRLKTDSNVTFTLLDESGSVADILNNHLKTTGAGLLIMTTHGRGALTRFWLGSVADELVRRVEKPILLVRPKEAVEEVPDLTQEKTFQHILIPLDGSTLSEQMLEHAVALGKLTQANYTLLRVIEPIVPANFPHTEQSLKAEQKLLEQLQSEAQTYLDGVAERLRLRSFQVQTRVVVHRH
ncbi:MAG: universal stress protein, partial [Nitrososphaera sp.]|nr:universal stress protein [Nitrososphaera sp.]